MSGIYVAVAQKPTEQGGMHMRVLKRGTKDECEAVPKTRTGLNIGAVVVLTQERWEEMKAQKLA